MNNLDLQELEQKIHQWSNTIGNASVPHGWVFAVGFDDTVHERWPGLSLPDVVIEKMVDIILDDKVDTPLRARMEAMDEVCTYIAKVVAEKNFPERVLIKEPGRDKPKLDFQKLADYIQDVYFVNMHTRSRIQNVLTAHINAEAQRSSKNKM